ncbi:hypothetical protein R9C00_10305 [Flammeovirgaceae bacterium SG7u.111]|nr:hypothetical protein [Flammeovirgaceae bacterium SG7u.132]WPO37844.1 hypothetical protein R9C00_10305 [Flammeovirgaceae bacterium SG7u.111]
MKSIFQILGIALFFFLIGYFLTYPYELSYQGNETIILLEDSYECASMEELVNRKEFDGKVLYIRIWEPFDNEIKPYNSKELAAFHSKYELDPDESILLRAQGRVVRTVPLEKQLAAFDSVYQKYKNQPAAIVYITMPDNDFPNREDDFRKWKIAIKKYEIQGYHLVTNPELNKSIRRDSTIEGPLPFHLLVDKEGQIVNYQAPWPQDTSLLYPAINILLAN